MQDTKLAVKVKPFSSRSRVLGFNDGILEVSLSAKPKDGEANEELRRVLSEVLGVPRSTVSIESGHTSRTKLVAVFGLPHEETVRRLDANGQEETPQET